ncbi:hypothetical protein BJ166DRAFT_500322 [Pestalotiopsis sp. NC0098]|nr:hypothetical protein BJ166DRAFT_500322 [Pestalotiopsis sp. NC0098]
MTMEQQPTVAMGTKTQWAKPQDWDKFRNTITALFMCHSLPVVMRVMREEHQFHATILTYKQSPKMFQSQIYQKWGLRKTKPGEAKKEAKARKRRREDSEDVESDVSPRSNSQTVVDDDGNSGHDIKDTSPPGVNPSEATSELAASLDDTAASTASTKVDDSQPAAGPDGCHLDLPPPKGWTDFLTQGPTHLQLGVSQDQSACAMPKPTACEDHDHAHDHSVPEDHEPAPSWVSTVTMPLSTSSGFDQPSTAPSVVSTATHSTIHPRSSVSGYSGYSGYSGQSGHSGHSGHSGRSRYSGRSRSSRWSEYDETGMSSASSPKRHRMNAIIERRPMGCIHNLDSPDKFLPPEKSMFYARHFISSTFTTGMWALAQSSDPSLFDTECSKLERWYNDFNPAFDFLRENKVKTAFRLFKRCFANTKGIIEPQDPRLVIYLCQQAIRCMFYDTLGRNLSQTLLKYIVGLCQVLFGTKHPLYIILLQLSRMNAFEFAQTIRPFMDCYFDHLEPFVSNSNNAFGHITEMRGLTVSLMEGTGMLGIYEAKPVLDRLVEKAEAKGLPNLHIKVETASMLSRNRFFNEALALLNEVRDFGEAEKNPYEYHYAGIMLVITYKKMKKLDEAIKVGYELSEFLSKPPSSYPGYPDNLSMSLRQYLESRASSLLLVLGKLEVDLREVGRIEEADKIKKRLYRDIMDSIGPEEPDEDPEAVVKAMS